MLRRSWLRFRIRTLLVLVAVVASAIGGGRFLRSQAARVIFEKYGFTFLVKSTS